MCQETKKLIFCTCENIEEKQEDSELLENFTWTLTNFLGLKKSLIKDANQGLKIDL